MARPTEIQEQIAVVRKLRKAKMLFCHVPNGGRRSLHEARLLKASGVVAGVPDLLIFTPPPADPSKRGVALEMKRQGGRPSDVSTAQRRWLAALEAEGWVTFVAFGAQNALERLRFLGYPV